MPFLRGLRTAGVLAASLTTSFIQAQDPIVQSVIDAVSVDSLVWDLERLSGEVAVNVGAGEQTITSRHKNNPGNALAADWLQQRLEALGYTVTVNTFGAVGENVLAVKTGAVHPERKVVLCGHYDAMPGGPVAAPAADDDGSGSCAVLEAARVMAPYTFENTLVFALWDEEEQGLLGSKAYAAGQAASDMELIATINMDAIAYDGDGDGVMRVHTQPIANSIAIKDTALMVNGTYGLDLPITVVDPGMTYSDHQAFWLEHYGAILIIEDFEGDGNPHYHTSTDLLEHMDLGYWTKLARLGIGTAATWAVPMEVGTDVAVQPARRAPFVQAFPNPVANDLRIRMVVEGPTRQDIRFTDALGRDVLSVHQGPLAPGQHVFDADLRALPAGPYLLRWSGADHAGSLRILHVR